MKKEELIDEAVKMQKDELSEDEVQVISDAELEPPPKKGRYNVEDPRVPPPSRVGVADLAFEDGEAADYVAGAPRPGAGPDANSQNQDRGGPWRGWHTVDTFLSRNKSVCPRQHFRVNYPKQWGPRGGPRVPAQGYPSLNDEGTRHHVINNLKHLK